jgi:leader peptidase (prepilin peptidase)/N-methyltransferase
MRTPPVCLPSVCRLGAASKSIVPTSTWPRLYERALVAAAAVIVVVASLAAARDLRGVLGAGLALLMLAIAVVDARRFIIPNTLTATALALGIAHAAVTAPLGITEAIALAGLRGVTMALLFFGLAAIYERTRGRKGLGLGDVKLAGVAGVWLDWLTVPIAIQFAALAAIAGYVLRNFARGRPLRATAAVPFGLFFAPSIWLSWLLDMLLVQPS